MTSRRSPWRLGLLWGLLGLGFVALLQAERFAVRLRALQAPVGPTAGGASTPAEQCRRSVPRHLVRACIEGVDQRIAAERLQHRIWLGSGVLLLAGAGGLWLQRTRSRRRHPKQT